MPKLIVTIDEGKLQGKELRNYAGEAFWGFFGIPYAEPPVGDLRFKAPVPKKPWKGIRKAIKEGPSCPSRHMFFRYYIGDEKNCLTLNVYTKSLLDERNPSLKPVMFFIHGGAFVTGSQTSKFFGPKYFMTEDIVLVTINYRLGVLGFLSLDDPTLGVPGNAGMKDMVLALKWVNKNIKNFSGNPKNVTIFGESAGAAAVHLLCLSPLTKNLFHKAIAQSGCALNCWARGCRNGKIIAQHLGYKDKEESKILKRLRRESPKKLVKAQHKVIMLFNANEVHPFGPVVEGHSSEPSFLPEDPVEILKKGTFHHVPLIMGYNSGEGIFLQLIWYAFPESKNQNYLENDIPYELNLKRDTIESLELVQKIKEFYFDGEDICPRNIPKLFMLKSDTEFNHGIHRSVTYHKKNGTARVYLYRMSLDAKLNHMKRISTMKRFYLHVFILYLLYKCPCALMKYCYKTLVKKTSYMNMEGACHGDDLGYMFNMFADSKLKPDSIEEISMKRFVKMWTNFARTGNPTPVKTDLIDELWRQLSEDKNYFLDIGTELKMGINPDEDRMNFWDSIYRKYMNN